MKLSIVIPARNEAAPDRLPRFLGELAAEDLADAEIVVVDDQSTDDTWGAISRACENFPSLRRAVFRIKTDVQSYCGGARNIGAEIANGDYYWFIDGDCHLAKGAVARVKSVLDRGPDMVCVGINDYLPNGDVLGASVTASSKAIRHDLFVRFREDWGWEDVDWWIRQLDRCNLANVAYIEEPLVRFPDKRMSASIESFLRMEIKVWGLINRLVVVDPPLNPRTAASCLRVAAALVDLKLCGEIKNPAVVRKLDDYLERHLGYVRRMF